MKMTFLYLIVSISILSSVKAQKTIVYDSLTIKLNDPKTYTLNKQNYLGYIKYGKPIKIYIDDVNKRVYKIGEDVQKNNLNMDLPAAFEGIKLPSFINLGKFSPLNVSGFKPQTQAKKSGQKPQNCCDYLLQYLDTATKSLEARFGAIDNLNSSINRNATTLFNSSIMYNDIVYLSKNGSDTFPRISKLLQDVLTQFVKNNQPSIQPDIKSIESLIKALLIDINTDGEKTKTVSDTVENRIDFLLGLADKADDACDSCQKSLLLNTYVFQLKFKKKNIDDNLANLKDVLGDVKKYQTDDQLNKILLAYTLVSNPNNYTYTSLLTNTRADEIVYTYTITPADVNSGSLPDKTVIEVPLRTYGGLKIDFSAGVFANWGSPNFLGRTYGYEYTTSDSSKKKIVATEEGTRALLSIGALAHIYTRSINFFKPALSFGVSTSTGFDELNFHGGVSAIIGNKNRLILTFGSTLRTATQLGKNQFGDQLYVDVENSSNNFPETIPTINRFPKAGLFLSITYNLAPFVKSK